MDKCDDIFPPSIVTRIRTDTFAYVLLKPKWDCVNIKLAISHSPRWSANRSPLQLLKWSFQDKKELIVTIGYFGEVNDHLLEMVRLRELRLSSWGQAQCAPTDPKQNRLFHLTTLPAERGINLHPPPLPVKDGVIPKGRTDIISFQITQRAWVSSRKVSCFCCSKSPKRNLR